LDRAIVIGGLGVKSEPPDARHALEHGVEAGLDADEIRDARLQRLDGGRQRLPAPGFRRVVGLPGQHVAEASARQHCDDDQDRKRSDGAQDQRLVAREALRIAAGPDAKRLQQPVLQGRSIVFATRHRSPRPILNPTRKPNR
jgi:hypothetical protein